MSQRQRAIGIAVGTCGLAALLAACGSGSGGSGTSAGNGGGGAPAQGNLSESLTLSGAVNATLTNGSQNPANPSQACGPISGGSTYSFAIDGKLNGQDWVVGAEVGMYSGPKQYTPDTVDVSAESATWSFVSGTMTVNADQHSGSLNADLKVSGQPVKTVVEHISGNWDCGALSAQSGSPAVVAGKPTLSITTTLSGAVSGTATGSMSVSASSCSAFASTPSSNGMPFNVPQDSSPINGHKVTFSAPVGNYHGAGTYMTDAFGDPSQVTLAADASSDSDPFTPVSAPGSETLTVNADGSGKFTFSNWGDTGSRMESGSVTWTCM